MALLLAEIAEALLFGEVFTGTYDQVVGTTIGIVTGLQKLVMLQFKLDDLGGPVRTAQVSAAICQNGAELLNCLGSHIKLVSRDFQFIANPGVRRKSSAIYGLRSIERETD